MLSHTSDPYREGRLEPYTVYWPYIETSLFRACPLCFFELLTLFGLPSFFFSISLIENTVLFQQCAILLSYFNLTRA